MLDTFFRWLEDPLNAMAFFTVAVFVCWGGTLLLSRQRRHRRVKPTHHSRPHAYRRGSRGSMAARQGLSGPAVASRTVDRSGTQAITRHAEPQLADTGGALPLASWWPQIVDSPVAVMIVGESQSGKSTTARALLAERARTDQIVILDPHEKFNDWGSLQETVIGRDRNLDAIVAAMVALNVEFERRFKRGEQVDKGLTVFIDEVPAIIAAAPEVGDYLAAWLLEAAKAKFRVVFLTQEPGVEALGLKGKGRVRLSTRKVLLGAYAAGVPEALAWPAAIEVRSQTTSVDAAALPAMAARAAAIDPAAAWRSTAEPVRDDHDLASVGASDRTGSTHPRLVLADTNALHTGSVGLSDDDLIAELVRRGVSANKIRDLLGGTKSVVLDKVRALRSQAS